MKLPLRWGALALVAIWLGYGFVEQQAMKSGILIMAMGIALWTAFSLNIPAKRKPGPHDEGDDDENEYDSEEDKGRLN